MDSRAAVSQQASLGDFEQLPQELQVTLFSFFHPPAIARVQQTNKHYYKLLENKYFWKNQLTSAYPLTLFADSDDYKSQFKAAYLYETASALNRNDKKQIAMKVFHRFIQQHHNAWTYFYRGLLYIDGLGVKKDFDLGVRILVRSLEHNDYRAAIKLAEILINYKINNSLLYSRLIKRLSSMQAIERIPALIIENHKKTMQYSMLLSYLYAYGITVTSDFSIAESYFKISGIATSTDANKLCYLKFATFPNSLTNEQKALQILSFIERLKGQTANKTLRDITHFWCAYLAVLRSDIKSATHHLYRIEGLSYTAIARYNLLHTIDNTATDYAASLLTLINENHNAIEAAIELIFTLPCPLTERISAAELYLDGCLINIAKKVSNILRNEEDIHTLATEPNHIWWIQLAAQAGCKHSLDALLSVNAKDYPFICYALAIIYEFGILHSDTLQANHDKAEYYLHISQQAQLETYLMAGVDKKFACEEVTVFLQAKLNSLSPRSMLTFS